MGEPNVINVANDFSMYPGGRYLTDGDGNGTDFRERFLRPALATGKPVTVVLDGAYGYPSSFLEEAFGGLVRQGVPPNQILSTFQFVAKTPGFQRYIAQIERHVKAARPSPVH